MSDDILGVTPSLNFLDPTWRSVFDSITQKRPLPPTKISRIFISPNCRHIPEEGGENPWRGNTPSTSIFHIDVTQGLHYCIADFLGGYEVFTNTPLDKKFTKDV